MDRRFLFHHGARTLCAASAALSSRQERLSKLKARGLISLGFAFANCNGFRAELSTSGSFGFERIAYEKFFIGRGWSHALRLPCFVDASAASRRLAENRRCRSSRARARAGGDAADPTCCRDCCDSRCRAAGGSDCGKAGADPGRACLAVAADRNGHTRRSRARARAVGDPCKAGRARFEPSPQKPDDKRTRQAEARAGCKEGDNRLACKEACAVEPGEKTERPLTASRSRPGGDTEATTG
jgi:hypothetical protein